MRASARHRPKALAAGAAFAALLLACAPRPQAGFAPVEVGEAPGRGPEVARVTIVEFGDFRCAYCAGMLPTLERLRAEHSDELRVVFKHFPVMGEASSRAARAAVAAQRQDAFWPMHDALFGLRNQPIDEAALLRVAGALGLDLARFRADLDDPATQAQVRADHAQGRALGVRGIPAFFVNGRPMPGAQSYEALEYAILEILQYE